MKVVISCLLYCIISISGVKAAEPLLFVGTHFPLILEQEPDGNLRGVAVQLIQIIMAHSSQPYQIMVLPWKRAQSMMQEGLADMLIGPYKSPERQAYLDYSSTPFYIDQMVLYTWKGNTILWQGDFAALSRKLLGIPFGWTGGASFESVRANLRIYEVPELSNALEMLSRKRLDVVLSNQRNAIATVAALKLEDKLMVLSPIVQTIEGYFGFSKQRDLSALKSLFEQQMALLDTDGTIKRINQQYGLQFSHF